jgi:hypothetical protein
MQLRPKDKFFIKFMIYFRYGAKKILVSSVIGAFAGGAISLLIAFYYLELPFFPESLAHIIGGSLSGSYVQRELILKYIPKRSFNLGSVAGCIIGALISFPVAVLLSSLCGLTFGAIGGIFLGGDLGLGGEFGLIGGYFISSIVVMLIIIIFCASLGLFSGYFIHASIYKIKKLFGEY